MNNWNIVTDDCKKKTSEILEELRKHFEVFFYNEISVDKEFTPPKKTTTRTFAPNVEADENLKNMSANQLKEKGIECITLRERLIMELQYFKETRKHLDLDNWTLCAGSRGSNGGVPGVSYGRGGRWLSVCWLGPRDAVGDLRPRATDLQIKRSITPERFAQAFFIANP